MERCKIKRKQCKGCKIKFKCSHHTAYLTGLVSEIILINCPCNECLIKMICEIPCNEFDIYIRISIDGIREREKEYRNERM